MSLGLHLVSPLNSPATRPQRAQSPALGGFAGALWALFQHWQNGVRKPAARHMRVLETLTLAPRKQLFLVHCEGHRFLIGTGADGIQTITRVNAEATPATAPRQKAGLEGEQC